MLRNLNNPASRPLLYFITNRQQLHASTETSWQKQIELLAQAVQAGCQLIQIREKDLSARKLIEFVTAAIAVARPFGARVLVNDRLDVALASGADGVHLRTDSLPVFEVRRIVPNEFLVGVSTHTPDEAAKAETEGADFIVTGPVFYTPSKAGYGAPMGLERLAEICRKVTIPVLALGGINLNNFVDCLTAGAAGIAAISLFNNPQSLGTNIKIMLSS